MQDLQALADTIGLEIRIAHFPPYCSKHNPIEHRLFPHVTRACEGVVFENLPLVQELIENTNTSTGLKVTVDIIDKVYQTGRKVSQQLRESFQVVAGALLPVWNYTILPHSLGLIKTEVISRQFLSVTICDVERAILVKRNIGRVDELTG